MSDNAKTIAYLHEHFLNNNIKKISNIFSPHFKFYVNNEDTAGFEEFANQMAEACEDIVLVSGKMTSQDDIHFSAEIELPIITEDNEMITQVGFVEVQIRNCLIESFNLHFQTKADAIQDLHQMTQNVA